MNLGLRLRVGRELERLEAMRLQVMHVPDPVDGTVRDAADGRQLAGAPMGEPVGRRLQRLQPPPAHGCVCRDGRRAARSGLVVQAGHALLGRASTKPADLVTGATRALRTGGLVGQQQHDARPPTEAFRSAGGALQTLQRRAIRVAQERGRENDWPCRLPERYV